MKTGSAAICGEPLAHSLTSQGATQSPLTTTDKWALSRHGYMHTLNDEQYRVEFANKPGVTYQRFVDSWGQDDPDKYVQDFNRRSAR
jgi:hypothetical protein